MLFDRLRFPGDYHRSPIEPPCSLDSLVALDANLLPIERDERDTFAIGTRLRFSGWALMPVPGGYRLPGAVLVRIGDTKIYYRASSLIAREDVARNMGDERLVNAGFRGLQTIGEDVPIGRHRLGIAVVGDDRGYVEVAVSREIEIVESSRLFPDVPQSARVTVGPIALTAMHERPSSSGAARFAHGSILVARGEALERQTQAPASQVFAIVDDRRYYGGVVGLANDLGERTAFSIRIPTRHMNAGTHALRIAAVASDRASFSLGEPTRFILSGA